MTNISNLLKSAKQIQSSKFDFNHFEPDENRITFYEFLLSNFSYGTIPEKYVDICEKNFNIKRNTIEFEWLFSGLWKYVDNSKEGFLKRLDIYFNFFNDTSSIPRGSSGVPIFFTGFKNNPFKPDWVNKYFELSNSINKIPSSWKDYTDYSIKKT